jgi:hypothetical protein
VLVHHLFTESTGHWELYFPHGNSGKVGVCLITGIGGSIDEELSELHYS